MSACLINACSWSGLLMLCVSNGMLVLSCFLESPRQYLSSVSPVVIGPRIIGLLSSLHSQHPTTRRGLRNLQKNPKPRGLSTPFPKGRCEIVFFRIKKQLLWSQIFFSSQGFRGSISIWLPTCGLSSLPSNESLDWC